MRRASRVDANQSELIRVARQLGAGILYLHQLGEGTGDFLLGWRGRNIMIECKTLNGVVSPEQALWHATWSGQVDVARDVDELIGIMERETRGEN